MTTTASTSRKPIKIWKGQVWVWRNTGYEAFFVIQPFEDKMWIKIILYIIYIYMYNIYIYIYIILYYINIYIYI